MDTTLQDKIAICPGSFDPPSFGHINIIERTLRIAQNVIVAVAAANSKNSLFTVDERVNMMKQIFKDEPRISIDSFDGLLVDFAKKNKSHILVRGIRTVSDYEYELQMSLANRTLDETIETIFMMTEGRYSYISSSIIKQVIALGGSGKDMIHPYVEKMLKKKLFR